MAKLTQGDEVRDENGPYVVKTGQPVTWYLGILVISLVASAVVGGLVVYFDKLSVFGAIACATGVVWSAVAVFQSTRTEWVFSADSLAYRETSLLKTRQTLIPAEDIEAVGVEIRRGAPVSNPAATFGLLGLMDAIGEDAKRRKAGEAGQAVAYRLAFKLRNGEVMKIDREQGRDDFADTLRQLARRMPRVTWPALGPASGPTTGMNGG